MPLNRYVYVFRMIIACHKRPCCHDRTRPAYGDRLRMNAPEAEAAYRLVKSELDAHRISLDEYNRRVAALRYLDNTGTWWAISPKDGTWLLWNGMAWEPGFVSGAPSRTIVQQAVPAVGMPRTSVRALETGSENPPAEQIPSPVIRSQWPAGKKYAAGSIACGVASFFLFPYILGIAGILIGIAALREKYMPGAIGVLLSAAVMPVAYLISLPP
jgi:hypothetical protein